MYGDGAMIIRRFFRFKMIFPMLSSKIIFNNVIDSETVLCKIDNVMRRQYKMEKKSNEKNIYRVNSRCDSSRYE